jgi:hypothetical protein
MTSTAQPIFFDAETASARPLEWALSWIVLGISWIATVDWRPPSRTMPGEVEARWYSENQSRLTNEQGLWVGIKDDRIVARGANLSEVHNQLTRLEILDALIVQVPEDLGHPRTLIA